MNFEKEAYIFEKDLVFKAIEPSDLFYDKTKTTAQVKSKFIKVLKRLKSKSDETKFDVLISRFFIKKGFYDELSSDFRGSVLEKKSLLNFARYLEQLNPFLNKGDFYLEVTQDNFLKLRLFSQNHFGILELVFHSNGVVNYLLLDKEYDSSEKKTFVMRGGVETSSKLSKSYKLNRLLFSLRFIDLYSTFPEKSASVPRFYIKNTTQIFCRDTNGY